MRGVNKVILVGTLGADPVVRGAVTSLSVATNESWTDKATGQKQTSTEWHRVTLFARLGEIASEYCRKGKQVYIEGRLRTQKYTDKQGIERYETSIIADSMQLLGGVETGAAPRGGSGQKPAGPEVNQYGDEIPF